MRQVKSLIRNLEKSDDPMAHQQLLTLQQMMHQLSIEQSNSDPRRARFNALDQQRHRHLNDRTESGTHDFTLQSAHGLENSLDGDPTIDLQYAQQLQEEKEGLMQQNEIMRKIIESQKKLSALQEQHDHVLSIQKKAENKLAEAKALQDQLAVSNPDLSEWVTQMQREAAAGTLLLPPTTVVREPRRGGTPSSSRRLQQQQQQQHPTGPPPPHAAVGNVPGGDSSSAWAAWDLAADGASFDAAGGAVGGLPWESSTGNLGIEHLERRVRQLQGVAAQQGKLGFVDREDAAVECEQAELQSSQLTDNIRALQEQKFHVDRLLSELTTLQSEASSLGFHGNLATGSVNQVSKADPVMRAPPAKGSVPFEQLSSKEKRRQVNEMRKTLQQLQSAVKNLEPDVTHGATGSNPDAAAAAALLDLEPRPPRGSVTYKKDNLQGDFPARRHYEAEGRANEEPDVVAGVATATAAVQQQQPPADLLASAQGKASGDVLADKVRQLQTTRNQLQYLQSLVASLQDDTADSVATAPGNSLPSGGEADPRREQQQRRCLQQLQEQRLRLSLLRQQLTPGGGGGQQQLPAKNQMRAAPAAAAEAPQRLLPPPPPQATTRLGGPSAEGPSPAKKDNLSPQPKNLYDPAKASNRSLEQQQSSLNLEPSGGGGGALSRDKAILEELLQQERSKQLLSYSHNEDVRSPSSCSASSGPMEEPGGSVMAGGNTTIAATWGGSSTQENLEDDEDDDEDRQEGSVGAGHDSEGSRSDFENDTSRAMPPPIPGRDHPHAAADASPAPLGRMDNRLTHTNLTRVVNGPYSRGGQPSRWQGSAGLLNAPILRQHSAGGQNEATTPDDERAVGGVAGQMMHQLSQHLQQQLETTNAIYQSILQEQQALTASSAAAISPGASIRVPTMDAVQHCAIQQQLLLSIIHCYQLLSIQQLEISQLQHATHQGYSPMVDEALGGGGGAALPSGDHGGSPFLLSTELTSAAWAQGAGAAAHQPLHHALPTEARGAPPGATLNNQVVPGCRANNFWDNFRSYSRQNLLSNPGTAPKTNELPANFQVQHTHPSGPIPMATASRMKSWTSPRDPRDGPTSSVLTGSSSRARQVRPVLNVWPQEPAGNRTNDSKQANGSQSHLCSLDPVADAPSMSSLRQQASAAFQQQQQQQPACDVLKMSIGAEVSRLLEGKEDAASLAAVLRQLQLLNCPPQPDLSLGQPCGGARRKVPSSVKSNVPKENHALNGDSPLVFQRGTSESSPDLVASVEFSADSRTRTEETLSDSSFDKNTSRPLAAVTARKRAKPLCSSASQPPHLPTLSSSSSLERSAAAEQMVAERDCDADEEQGATARPVEPAFEQTWPERDTTVSAPAVELPPPSVEGPAAEPLPGLDNMLLLAEAHALRGVNQDVQQAMYNFEMALLRQGLVADGEQQGEEAEDDEDRELETEPEAEGTQDLAEADQSPAAEQDAADQQPEDVAAPAALLGAVGGAVSGAVGGADGGTADLPIEDPVARPAAPQDEPEVSHEEAAAAPGGNQSEDSSTRQQDGAHPPNS